MSMADSKPLVSIGMPVYNEERYIARALDSLLAQDYEHFELHICDNASTDRTLEIAREYAGKDPRIKIHPAPQNRGAIWNFNRAFHLSQGKYFMWAAADDQWHPSFIRKCVTLLEEEPSVVLAYPQSAIVDDDGQVHAIWGFSDTRDLHSPIQRFLVHLLGVTLNNMVYGVIRADALRKTGLLRLTLGSDIVLVGELSLYGHIANIPEVLFFRRRVRLGEDRKKRHKRWRSQIAPQGLRFPYLRIIHAYLDAIKKAPIGMKHKMILYPVTLMLVVYRYRHLLLKP